MKIAYFDCSSGIAGNMILGALVDAGVDANFLKKELSKLDIGHWILNIGLKKRGAIRGTLIEIKREKEKHHRNLKNIITIIKNSKLSKKVKNLSTKIFKRLAVAEARVHGESINNIHFHEVGAVDAIIDIVGTVVCLEKLGIEKVYCSLIPHGKGIIRHTHGILPIPAPATAELLKGIPTYGINVKGELVTPTGAAIISTIAEDFTDTPRMLVKSIGYGAGSLTFPSLSNLLRIFIGEAEIPAEKDAILQIEANIDDMNPQNYDQAIAKIMKAGALDASIHPIRMKKKRKAIKLEILCQPQDKNKILTVIFSETTTIGTRLYLVTREKLKRKVIKGIKHSYLGKRLIRSKIE